MEKYFNFNNEEYILPIDLAEDGTVTMQANGQEIRFATVQELAENYAIARNVATENLKNWTLVEDLLICTTRSYSWGRLFPRR